MSLAPSLPQAGVPLPVVSRFPDYSVKGNVAEICLTAGNGYVHHFRVPKNLLGFLKKHWPLSVRGVTKKIFKGSTPLHTIWLRGRIQKHGLIPKCKNHNWLDWTRGNVFVPRGKKVDALPRARALTNKLDLSAEAFETLQRRFDTTIHLPPDLDPEIAEIFSEAQGMAALPVRPSGPGPTCDDADPTADAADAPPQVDLDDQFEADFEADGESKN
jgi:hypothetical protein